MDTSPEYILQCEKAEEIQKAWKPIEGDFVSVHSPKWLGGHIETVLKDGLRNSLIVSREWEEDDFLDRDISIWLPRQDELQAMVLLEHFSIQELLGCFSSWVTPFGVIINNYAEQFSTLEQMWLAFVMSELYHKKWYAGEWVSLCKSLAENTKGRE